MNSRRLLTVAGIALAAVLLAGQVRQLLADPTIWPPDDFVEYWAAARLTLAGQNPYDPALLLPLQHAAGRATDEAVMMWNPPWSLTAVLPLGLLPAREAQLLWLLVNLAAVGFCGDRLWLMFGGSRERRWVGWAVALAFLPTLFALQSGQIGPMLLLGAVLFLECEGRGWPVLAGAATVLLAVKPHLAYLVWVAILCDTVTRRRVGMVAGGILAGTVATLIPLAFNPHLLHQYADAMGNRPPEQWVSPTLGTVLRLTFGEEMFRLQFVPVAVGLVWFAYHWRRTGKAWDWTEELPLLLLVSFVTAPYGAWPFDMVLLLPAVVRLVAGVMSCGRSLLVSESEPCFLPLPLRERASGAQHRAGEGSERASDPSPGPLAALTAHPLPQGERVGNPVHGGGIAVLVTLLAINLACLLMNLFQTGSFAFIWVPPAILLVYALSRPHSPQLSSSPRHPLSPSCPAVTA